MTLKDSSEKFNGICGICVIINLVKNMALVIKADDVGEILYAHADRLEIGNHNKEKLQLHYNEQHGKGFTCRLLEKVKREDKKQMGKSFRKWIKEFDSFSAKYGYNKKGGNWVKRVKLTTDEKLLANAEISRRMTGNKNGIGKRSEEFRVKMSVARLAYFQRKREAEQGVKQ